MEDQVPISSTQGYLSKQAGLAALVALGGGLASLLSALSRDRFVAEAYATEYEARGRGSRSTRSWWAISPEYDTEEKVLLIVEEMLLRLPPARSAWLGRLRVVRFPFKDVVALRKEHEQLSAKLEASSPKPKSE
jgi:hypothetical protein